MKPAFILSILGFAVLMSACSYRYEKPVPGGANAAQSSARADLAYPLVRDQVFIPHCVSCHGHAGGVNLETCDSIKANLEAVRRAVLVDKSMPRGGALNDAEASLLRDWIDAGAPETAPGAPPEQPEPAPSVSPAPAPAPSVAAPSGPSAVVPTGWAKVQPVLQKNCYACHSGAAAVANYVSDFSTIAVVRDEAQTILKYAVINKSMPPGADDLDPGQPLIQMDDASRAVIKSWIDDGMLE